jgi:hypothetical protein
MINLSISRFLALPAAGALAAATMLGGSPAASGFGPHIGGPESNSGNWGGYAATAAAGTFTTITGSWTEPAATCTNDSELAAPWLGLDGYGDETVEQTGLAVSCSTGKPEYEGWYEMYPAAPHYFSNPASAGDTIDASVTFKAPHSYTLTLKDVTKGWTHTETKTLSSAKNASAEAVIEGPGGYPTFPNGVTFTDITVNGHPFSYYDPTKLTSSGFVPGPLSGGNFTITHK